MCMRGIYVTRRIVMVGGGAIGGITGTYMAEAGHDVTIYDVDSEHVQAIQENGLHIDGVRGEKDFSVAVTDSLEGTYDLAFLAVKGPHTEEALNALLPHLSDDAPVVSLQNGINEEYIAGRVGEGRTIGAVTGWGGTNKGPGHLAQTSEGKFIVGRLDGRMTPELEEIQELLSCCTETETTGNIWGHLWTKLLINAAITGLGVCFGVKLHRLVHDERLAPLMAGLTSELVSVAQHAGVTLEKFEDALDPNLLRIDTLDDYRRVIAIMRIAAEKHRALKSSMWQDIEKGRRTEIRHINGYLEEKAQELGIPTPVNGLTIQVVEEIEAGERQPSYDNAETFYRELRIPAAWRQYDIEEDAFSDLALYHLPTGYHHEQAAQLAGVHAIGLSSAFATGLRRLTESLIGKLFVRKSAWDISNAVLTRFLEEMRKKYARTVSDIYGLDGDKSSDLACLAVSLFNHLDVEYTPQQLGDDVSRLSRDGAAGCPYLEAALKVDVADAVDFPVCRHLFSGMAEEMGDMTATCTAARCTGDDGCTFLFRRK